jgi:predicted 3-demethylubiquinone-9 3-methyltransferase (glyoxalase superfamily)
MKGERMQRFMPCLWFDGKAEAAARFYISVFKNSKIKEITHYGASGAEASGMSQGSVMTVVFQLDGQDFMALNGGPQFTFSPAISIHVSCANQDEVDLLWAKLSEGGEKGVCGWLTDEYGVSWQIVPTRLGEMLRSEKDGKAENVMKALRKMNKIDIKALETAYDQ